MEREISVTHSLDLPDTEFGLPELKQDEFPSLESILQEKESDVYNFEDLNFINVDENQLDDGNISITSESLPIPNISISDLLKTKKPSVHGSVLRHVILRKMSSQMNDACERRDAGLPTAMAVCNLMVIGTSHGLSLVFEPKDQILKLVLGTKDDGDKYGAVTALAINGDCTRLLCGYAQGQITMWDLDDGSCLRVITEAHQVGFAVLNIQFTDDPTIAMLNDSSGSVYILSFKRRLTRTCESSCFFSGTKGEVCIMAPLHVSPNLKKTYFSNLSLLAMATLTKLIVVDMNNIKPIAVFMQKMSGPEGCLPLLCWYFTLTESKTLDQVIVPVLAFGRNRTILLYKVEKIQEQFQFQCYKSFYFEYSLISMAWLNSQIIVTIDTYERIRTLDINTGEELECLDLSSVKLVYGSSYFRSLPSGGNASNALKAAGEYACYQSVKFYNGQLFFLGTKTIHCLAIRNWKDRLDFFVKRNQFIEALELAKLFYLEKAKAVIGLAGTKKAKRIKIAAEMVSILLSYLDVSMIVNCPKTNDESILRPYFKSLVGVSIECCLLIDDVEILFTDVYDRFSGNIITKQEFLQGLESFIIDNKLTSLSAVLMQDLIEHFESSGRLQSLQSCIVHLNLSSIDIDHMVKLCWAHHLYNLVIYVYNKGLNDYITPFERLLSLLREELDQCSGYLSDMYMTLGQNILVYLSCCLAGNQYPIGKINEDHVKEVKDSVFNFIMAKYSRELNNSEKYHNISTLLRFDTQELLNVLSLAFEEKEFVPNILELRKCSKRQQVVDILIQVVLNSEIFSSSQVGCLFTFIARQMAKYRHSIQINDSLFETILEFLTNPDEEKRHEEREQALLELHYAGGLDHFPEERILQLAEEAKFYRVCEIIYQKERQYDKVLSCYWRDASRKNQVYGYIDSIINTESCTDLDKEEILSAVLMSMDYLVEINSMKFAWLIINHFPASFNNVASKLQNQPEIQYAFLKGVFHMKSEVKSEKHKFNVNPVLHEKFIELMCSYEAESVCSYLQNNDTYRLEEVLEIVQGKKLIQASAYLYERMGDVQNAFKLLSDDLQSKVQCLHQLFLEMSVNDSEIGEEIKDALCSCRKALQTVMQMCLRNSLQLERNDREDLWFPLLETMMKPQRRIKNTASHHFLIFKELTKDVLINMMEFISLPTVLQKIMHDPTYSSGKFSEIKDLIFGMIDTYNYELTLLETTTKLLGIDLLGQYNQERNILCRGFRPNVNRCYLCTRNFDLDNRVKNGHEFILFRCGHTYHRNCLQGAVGFDEELICLQCDKSSRIRTVGYSRTFSKRERGKSRVKKGKPGDNTDQYQSQLSEQQEESLNNLWQLRDNPSEMKHLFEENGRGFAVYFP